MLLDYARLRRDWPICHFAHIKPMKSMLVQLVLEETLMSDPILGSHSCSNLGVGAKHLI
jgi:hypothetical protein